MKFKCLYNSILRGDTVKAGRIVDLTEDEAGMDVVKKFFVPVESGDAATGAPAAESPAPAPAHAARSVVAGLTRDQAIMKLSQAGVKVKGNISNDKLAETYNMTFSNLAEVTAK